MGDGVRASDQYILFFFVVINSESGQEWKIFSRVCRLLLGFIAYNDKFTIGCFVTSCMELKRKAMLTFYIL